jgi:hypothetical protein
VAVEAAVPARTRSKGHVAALVAGVACFVVIGIGAVWPLRLPVHTPHGTVSWDCGSRMSAEHHTLAQTGQILGDTRAMTVGNSTLSPSQVAAIDKSSMDANCARDLGAAWVVGAVLVAVAGVLLVGVGLARVAWGWLVLPLLIALGVLAWGVALLFPGVGRS